jgi:sugar diacid utilization regulator
MLATRAETLIRHWGARLRADALAARVVRSLDDRQSEVSLCTLDLLRRENPAFGRAGAEKFREEALAHCHDIWAAMFAIALGRPGDIGHDPFAFVRSHAVRRARQQFPLAGSLYAYRLAHKSYWAIMRETALSYADGEEATSGCLLMLAEFLVEYFDHVSAVLTDAHLTEEKLLIAQRTRAHVTLIEDLMLGHKPDAAETRELCERCGILPGARVAIAIARSDPSAEAARTDRDATLRHLLQTVEQAIPSGAFGKLVDIRNGEVLAIISSAGDTAGGVAAALRTAFATLSIETRALARAGVSLDATDVEGLPRAYQEAARAVEFAEPGRPVMHFAEIDLLEFLTRRPDTAAFRLIPDWVESFTQADRGKDGQLSRTISTFADCNLNVKLTARRLRLHTNTVYFRLNRIRDLTGIDPRSFSGVSLLLASLRLLAAQGRATRQANG